MATFLNDADVAVLRELVAAHRGRVTNASSSSKTTQDSTDQVTPTEVFVAYVPSVGIRAMRGVTPSPIVCELYRLVPSSVVNTSSIEPIFRSELIYNLSTEFDVSGSQYCTVHKDKFGYWYPVSFDVTESLVGTSSENETGTSSATSTFEAIGTATSTGSIIYDIGTGTGTGCTSYTATRYVEICDEAGVVSRYTYEETLSTVDGCLVVSTTDMVLVDCGEILDIRLVQDICLNPITIPAIDLSDPDQVTGGLPLTIAGDVSGSGTVPGTIVLTLTSTSSGGGGTVTSVDVSGGTTGLTTSGGPITGSGTITLAGTLAIANGGTGATTAAGARANLGVGTGSGTVTSVNITPPVAGIAVTGGPITTSGSFAITLADDLAAIELLTGTNTIHYRSGVSTWSPVTIGTGLTFSGGTLSSSIGSIPPGVVCGFPMTGTVPAGWVEVGIGGTSNRITNAGLFLAWSTTHGAGDGSTTFGLPDWRGRALIGAGTGSGLTARANLSTGGFETHTLTTAESAAHTHSMPNLVFYNAAPSGIVNISSTAGTNDTVASISTNSTGGGGAHNNMQPFYATRWITPGN